MGYTELYILYFFVFTHDTCTSCTYFFLKIYIIHSSKNLIGEVPLEVACRSHSWMASTSTHGQSWLWGILEFLARCGTQDNHHSCDSGCWKVAGSVYYIPKPRYQKTRVINDMHGTNWQQRMIDMIVCYQAHVFTTTKRHRLVLLKSWCPSAMLTWSQSFQGAKTRGNSLVIVFENKHPK